MRVIAGEKKGHILKAPTGRETRPVTDRVKEAVFSSLGPDLVHQVRVADLFAGAGSFGIEALSRGAQHATFVEKEAKPARVLEDNLKNLFSYARFTINNQSVESFLSQQQDRFDLVFCDPPWSFPTKQLDEVLTALNSILAEGARVVTSRRRGDPIPLSNQLNNQPLTPHQNLSNPSQSTDILQVEKKNSYGDTTIIRYRLLSR